MTGDPTDPKTWAAYEQVYGRKHTLDPAYSGGDPLQAEIARTTPYTDFRSTSPQGYYPGRDVVDRAANIEGADLQGMINNPAAAQQMGFRDVSEFNLGGATDPMQFADAPTGEWLAKQMGGTFVPGGPDNQGTYNLGGPFNLPTAGMIQMPDGTMHNAGIVADRFSGIQQDYQRQLQNYERNLAQNPNIMGTGFLSKPGDPIQMLMNSLGGQPISNAGNDAGGNAGIQSALSQGQNAYGDPLGQGGLDTKFPNAPVSPDNPNMHVGGQQPVTGWQGQTPVWPGGSTGAQLPNGYSPTSPVPGYYGPGGNTGQTPDGSGGWTAPNTGGLNPGMGGGANPYQGLPGQGMPGGTSQFGWNPGTGGGGGGAGGQMPGYTQPQNYFQPMNPWQGTQNPFDPWQGLQGPGGISGLAQLLGNVQSLRNTGYGMFGGWNPMTGFGGGFGPFGGPYGMQGMSPYGSLGMSGMGPFGGGQMGGYSPFGGGGMNSMMGGSYGGGFGGGMPGGMLSSMQAFSPYQRPPQYGGSPSSMFYGMM
jgi:hypothetical protein